VSKFSVWRVGQEAGYSYSSDRSQSLFTGTIRAFSADEKQVAFNGRSGWWEVDRLMEPPTPIKESTNDFIVLPAKPKLSDDGLMTFVFFLGMFLGALSGAVITVVIAKAVGS
jgi:hypothetical protein